MVWNWYETDMHEEVLTFPPRGRRSWQSRVRAKRNYKRPDQPLAARGCRINMPVVRLPRARLGTPVNASVSFGPSSASANSGNGRGENNAPMPARWLEQQWLAQHQAAYAGEWLALQGSNLVAHGSSLRKVLAAAKAAGHAQPLVVQAPSDRELDFGGW